MARTPSVPNALSDQQRAETVLATIANLQRESLELGLRRITVGATDLSTAVVRDGEEVTYRAELKRLEEAVAAIVADQADVIPLVNAEIERRAVAAEVPNA